MSWWKNLIKYAAPVVGAAAGSIGGGALGLNPALGGAIGGALGGVAGNEATGGDIKGDLIAGGLGGIGGYVAGPTLSDWAGTTPSASPGAISAAGIGASPNGGTSNLLNTIGSGSALSASLSQGGSLVPAAASAAPGIGGSAVSGISDFFARNPELLIGGAGLAATALSQPSEYPAENALQSQADLLGAAGAAGLNGKMTPSATIAFNDAVTSIRSSYANMGMAGSTMEAQDIEAARQRAIAASVQEGMSQLGMSQDLYSAILGYHQQQDSDLSSAIGNLMASVGYGLGAKA